MLCFSVFFSGCPLSRLLSTTTNHLRRCPVCRSICNQKNTDCENERVPPTDRSGHPSCPQSPYRTVLYQKPKELSNRCRCSCLSQNFCSVVLSPKKMTLGQRRNTAESRPRKTEYWNSNQRDAPSPSLSASANELNHTSPTERYLIQ